MSDSLPVSIGPVPEAAAALDPGAALAAAAEPGRLAVLRVLAEGPAICVNDIAARLGRAPDTISKHLRVLREARLVTLLPTAPGADGRRQFYEIPASLHSQDAAGRPVVDFGSVLLRL